MRLKHEKLLLEKLYDMGILSEGVRLAEVERKVGVSRLARRRLGVVMTRLRMSETVQGVGATLGSFFERDMIQFADLDWGIKGRQIYRARPRPRWSRSRHGPGLPRHPQHGGLRHVGRQQQGEAEYPQV